MLKVSSEVYAGHKKRLSGCILKAAPIFKIYVATHVKKGGALIRTLIDI